MATGIRLTKPERAYLRKYLVIGESNAEVKLHQSILDKLERSELTRATGQPAGIGWVRAVNAMKEVLGDRLAVPPNPTVGWISQMSTRIKNLGLTEDNCRTIARVQDRRSPGRPISFEMAIRYADLSLAEAALVGTAPVTKTTPRGPILMGDID